MSPSYPLPLRLLRRVLLLAMAVNEDGRVGVTEDSEVNLDLLNAAVGALSEVCSNGGFAATMDAEASTSLDVERDAFEDVVNSVKTAFQGADPCWPHARLFGDILGLAYAVLWEDEDACSAALQSAFDAYYATTRLMFASSRSLLLLSMISY